MAEKRMFTKKITDSDAFLSMPLSAQALYFHLNMSADDDGFVNNPKRIQRAIGASDDDYNLLIEKRFVIIFETGIIVIKHWKMHNYIQKDRYKPTDYTEEKSMLIIKENKAYSLTKKSKDTECVQSVSELDTDCTQNGRVDKISIDKNSKDKDLIVSKDTICTTDVARVIEMWNSLGLDRIIKINKGTQRYSMLKKRIEEYGMETITGAIEKVRQSSFLNGGNNKGWTITFDWFIRPNNFPKVIGGNYDNNRGGQHDKNGIRQMLENVEKKYEEN